MPCEGGWSIVIVWLLGRRSAQADDDGDDYHATSKRAEDVRLGKTTNRVSLHVPTSPCDTSLCDFEQDNNICDKNLVLPLSIGQQL